MCVCVCVCVFLCVRTDVAPHDNITTHKINDRRKETSATIERTINTMISSSAATVSRRALFKTRMAGRLLRGASMSTTSAQDQSHATVSYEKMEQDKRYQGSQEVPDSLLGGSDSSTGGIDVDAGFSIRGKFREGRAAYLDHSATTPLDPRVLDAMAPYMVRQSMYWQ